MNAKEIAIIAGNLALAGALVFLFATGRITWDQFGAAIALLAFPSAATLMKKSPPADAGILVLVSTLAIASAHFVGCAHIREQQAEADYKSEQLKCVDKYPTRELIDACRRKVRETWGIAETATDAGKDGAR